MICRLVVRGSFACILALATLGPTAAYWRVASRTASVECGPLQYRTAGDGEALILIHDFTQMSRMWWLVIPRIGNSAIPADDVTRISAAERIPALVVWPGQGVDMGTGASSVNASPALSIWWRL